MTRNASVNADRLWADVIALAQITDPNRPYTRRSFTPLFLEGRTWLETRFRDAGLTTRIDSGGNLIGRLEGKDPALGTIAIGSHSDTVPSGGRFDGIAGLLTALEVVRSLKDAGICLNHTIEVIDCLAEEPSEYGVSCIGSRAMVGALEPAMLELTEPGGERLRDALRRVGGDPDRLAAAARDDIAAFLELHIEQGIVLESQNLDIGVVTSLVGIKRIEIVFVGAAGHAGTTPLNLRQDALIAAAKTVTSVLDIARRISAEGPAYFVATTGILTVEPNSSNIVPGRCRLVVDARSTDSALIERFVQALNKASLDHASDAHVEREPLVILSSSPPVMCDPGLRQTLHACARNLGLKATDLPSGAGHDAGFMSRVCPSAMIFIPCRNGKSHTPEEWSDPGQIAAGASVILEAVKVIDRRQ